MTHGAPDYSNVTKEGELTRLTDLGEIPGRLSQPISIDRSGDVVLMESFPFGISSIESVDAGLGEQTALSALYSRYGGYTVKCDRIANADSYSGFNIHAPIVESGKLGAEAQFVVMTNEPNIKAYLARYTGTHRKLWGLRWDSRSDKIYIGGDTVGWTEIADGYDILQGVPRYHNMKFVVDVDDENYTRVFIDGKSVGVSEISAYTTTSTSSPHIVFTFYNGSGPTTISEVYLDFVILTRNEY